MTLKMSEGGDKSAIVETPAYIVTSGSDEASTTKGMQKKHVVIIVVGLIILAGLIIAGILVGIHITKEAEKEIAKFQLDFKSTTDGKDVKQDVVSDPNDNVVMFHVTKDGKDAYIVNDFNRDMQVVKMEMEFGTNCYISALNRSASMDPSQLNSPDLKTKSDGGRNSISTIYIMSSHPVSDRSFLPKKAQEMCKDVSVYWAYRGCNAPSTNGTDEMKMRQRRDIYYAGTWNGYPCYNGCCYTVCSCEGRIVEYSNGYSVYCEYFVSNSCPYTSFRQNTPGLNC